ncbi:MAG: electron transfer flavoprotein subunit alpha/FixB family protein [bacterium]
MKRSVVVVAQHNNDAISSITYESLSCAIRLCKDDYSRLKVVILGDQVEHLANQIAHKTGVNVIAVNNRYLSMYNAEVYIETLLTLFKDSAPDYVVVPHTYIGYDFAPVLALRLNASCITEVEDVVNNENGISFVRAMFGGKLSAEITSNTTTTVITTQPGAWQSADKIANNKGTVEVINKDIPPEFIRSIALKQAEVRETALTNSEIIISAGKGIGKKENLSLIYDLLQIFPRAGIGCSRAVCDAGWLDSKHQIGITGTTVSPKLYFAAGISGAIQHVSGIKDAKTIVAINIDPYAQIFKIADYCIVEDLTRFIPILIQEYKKFNSS